MRVLVAGATGDVGIPTVRALLERGHDVVAMSRGRRSSAVRELGVDEAVADALEPGAVDAAVARVRPEGVVDLMTALPRNGPMRPKHLRPTDDLRRRGTRNLHRAAVTHGARRYVAESIVFVYGYAAAGEPRTESDPVMSQSDTPPSYVPSLEAVLAKERLVTEGPIEGIALRFGLFYGPEAGSTRYMARMLRRHLLGLPGGGRGLVPWIHVDDAAAAVVAALGRGRAGEIYNVVDDEAASFRDFATVLAERTGAARPYPVPVGLVRPFLPYAAMFMSASRLRVSNEKARRELGWSPAYPTVREGLAAAAAAWRVPA